MEAHLPFLVNPREMLRASENGKGIACTQESNGVTYIRACRTRWYILLMQKERRNKRVKETTLQSDGRERISVPMNKRGMCEVSFSRFRVKVNETEKWTESFHSKTDPTKTVSPLSVHPSSARTYMYSCDTYLVSTYIRVREIKRNFAIV